VVALRQDGAWRLDPFRHVGDPFVAEIADYTVEIEADQLIGVVGSGVLTRVEKAGPNRRVWRFEAPASRDAAFALGRFLRGIQADTGTTTVRSWYPADQRDRGASNLAAATSAVKDYERRWGPLLVYDEIDIVETEGILGGMEYPGIIFTSAGTDALEGVPLLPDLISRTGFEDARARYVVGHEVAHQWWYAVVGNDQAREPWLDEALAEASTRLWLRAEEGDDRTWRITNLSASASPEPRVLGLGIGDFSTNTDYTETVYVGGAEVLIDLRERVGAATYDAILAEWYRREALSIGTIEEFIAVVEDVAGSDAARFLEGYL
jgi:aminopeptidase N